MTNSSETQIKILNLLYKLLQNNKTKEEPNDDIFQKIISFGNSLFIFFFDPLPYLFRENDDNVKMLNNTPVYKKIQLMILLTIFAYISYYIFGNFDTDKKYMQSSIWFWIMMFTVLITIVRIKPKFESSPVVSSQVVSSPNAI
jgi:hypothetical protein